MCTSKTDLPPPTSKLQAAFRKLEDESHHDAPDPPTFLAPVSKLQAALEPTLLKLANDSHKHAGHYAKDGSVASDAGETHLR